MNAKRLCTALLLAGSAFSAAAAEKAPISQCVDLGKNQEIVRSGGGQNFLLRDGDAHYLVTFRDGCSSLATTPSLSIVTGESSNRLCPEGTVVKTKRDNCTVAKVETIGADEYASRKRRASR